MVVMRMMLKSDDYNDRMMMKRITITTTG